MQVEGECTAHHGGHGRLEVSESDAADSRRCSGYVPDADRLAERLLEHHDRLFSGQGVGSAELEESWWVVGKDELGSGFGDVIGGEIARRRFTLAEDDDLAIGPVELGFSGEPDLLEQVPVVGLPRVPPSWRAHVRSAIFPLPSGVFADSAWRMLMAEINKKRSTRGACVAAIRFRWPTRSTSWKLVPFSPANSRAITVTVETTARAPATARSSEARSRKSPTASSTPSSRSVSALDVGRTSARTGTPTWRSRRTIRPPNSPVAPQTRIGLSDTATAFG